MVWPAGYKLQGGQYTIEKELGEGGFGVAYLARNAKGERVVIKTLNDTVQQRPDFDKFQQDFLNEALRLAKCNHPHIVPIHQVFQEGRLWCMVMEYIEGEDLATHLEKQGVLPEAEALRYIQQVGEALTVIHNNNLLHRDVKPNNILVRAGTSEAILIDFGIAREFTPDLTQTHTQFFSSGFAPIEQYDRLAKRGAYTDVYALAATLYVILTGQMPEPAPVRAAGTPLTSPKQHKSSISDNVNRAILKGMALKAKDRPQSVSDWLKLLGLGSSPTKTIIQNQPHRRQWPAYIALAGVVVAIFIALTLQPAPSVVVSPPKTSSPETFALVNTFTAGRHSASFSDVAFSPDGQTLASGRDNIKLWNIPTGQLKTTLTGHADWVDSVAFSPDGQTLASGSSDKTIKLWNIPTGELKMTLTGHFKCVNSVAFSPDGQTLASGSWDDTIKLWNIPTGELKTTLTDHSNVVDSVAFSPDGQTLASSSWDGTIKLWSIPTGQLKTTLSGGFWFVRSVVFSPDGQTLASIGGGKTIKLWNLRTDEIERTLTGHSDWVFSVAFSPDGQTLASGSSDKTIKLWNLHTGELKTTLTGHSDSVNSVAFSPDGQTLASGSWDDTIKLWQASP
ncbi:serine/threonine-protein kinase [Microcoleus sp. FACHB-672]|uniref:serine/threonine-protein kinase n=1 Tax=Microcoleus sp. FACHB-672 TaxID=2692825 RepID=UPI001682FB3C|nr:serine/threonine-protein kinase [Microcoleus sp. FACHB-672]MBD2043505.1 serine/threonine protein kinase [Microcoleus sp. FACHB-672]